MEMMSGFVGIVILVEPAKPGVLEKISSFFTRHCKQLKTVLKYIIS